MRRRVFKTGNSIAITLPQEARDLGIDEGAEVSVQVRDGAVIVTLHEDGPVTRELFEWTTAFVERNRDLLERLA